MEQGHTHTELVVLCELHVLTRQESIIGNVVMGQHHPLGEPCRTRRVLHVHHIVAIHLRLGLRQNLVLHIVSQQQYFGRIVHAAILLLPYVHHILHAGETLALQVSALAGLQLGKHRIYHVHIVIASPVAIHDAQGVHVRVLTQVLQLRLLVVGVHRHGHRANLGTSVQERQPIGHIARPDAHVRTTLHTDGEQSLGHVVHTLVEFAPRKPQVAVAINNILFVRRRFSPMLQPIAEGSIRKFHHLVFLVILFSLPTRQPISLVNSSTYSIKSAYIPRPESWQPVPDSHAGGGARWSRSRWCRPPR